jgi:hypothetical protein
MMNKFFYLLALSSPFSFAAEPVVVRSSVQPEVAWQGQRVQLVVEVLGKDSWAQIPTMPVFKVEGAYVLPPESQGVRAQATIDGVQYTGQRYELSVYPQQGGKIRIPATEVSVSLNSLGAGSEPSNSQAELPEVSFESKVPPGAEGVQWLVSTTRFEATQSWSSESTELKVGDVLKRAIQLTASDVSGMAFKPLEYPPMQGLGIYPAEPSVEDMRDRGTLNGLREEEVTYIFQGAGKAEIPAIELVWWDVQNEKLHTVVLEGKTITVRGGVSTSYSETGVGSVERSVYWWTAVILLGLGGVLFWRRERLHTAYREWKKLRMEREKVYFDRFAHAAGTGDIRQTQATLMQWLDRINTTNTPAQLETFIQQFSETQVPSETLIQTPTELYQVMVKARQQWLRSEKQRKKVDALLPELNG